METDNQAKRPAIAPATRSEPAAHRVIQPVPLVIPVPANDLESRLQRMEIALGKATQLLDRHLAAGQKTVPARALYFILRDAGYGTAPTEKHKLKPGEQGFRPAGLNEDPRPQVTDQLHHHYGMRR